MNNSTPKFNAKEVKCNGISSALVLINQENSQIIETYISTYRNLADFRKIVEGFGEDWSFYGRRCRENSTIAARITSGLANHALSLFNNNAELATEWVNFALRNISAKDLNVLVVEALRDCASADYWYTFEKEW
jgi:hypothetical protein